MNANRLHDVAKFLIELDGELGLQTRLLNVRDTLNNLTASPSDASTQTAFSNALQALAEGFQALKSRLAPGQMALIAEIGGSEFFDPALADKITKAIMANPIAPAVARDMVVKLFALRQAYLSDLTTILEGFEKLGVKGEALQPGAAELEVLIPRNLFENHLEELADELHTMNLIIRQFSEAAIGHPEPVEVYQISSSEPIFNFGMNLLTIGLIAKAVNWLLDAWKKAEEIKKLRQETKKAGFSEDELKVFDERITGTIKQAIDNHAHELAEQSKVDPARKNELENGLRWAMESLLARIERGVTIEVRLIEPPKPEKPEELEVFADLKTTVQNLQFPIAQGPPVLELPPPEPPSPRGAKKI